MGLSIYLFTHNGEVAKNGEIKEAPTASVGLPSYSQVKTSLVTNSAPALAKKFNSPEEFRVFTETSLQKLPKMEKFKNLGAEDVHEAPMLLRQAGAQLGDIAEAVKANPQLAPAAFQFYTDCSKEKDFPSSIRALCYSHYLHWANELKETKDENIVPVEVRDLAKKMN